MRELVQKTVDDRVYQFQQFNTTTAIKTMAKLTKLIGEPLTLAMGSFAEKKDPAAGLMDRDLDFEVLSKAVGALIERLDEDEVVSLVKRLTTESVLCDNKPIQFDEHFAGNISHLFKVVMAAIEAQYGNFLSAVTAKLPLSGTAQKPVVTVRQ